jgi:hypothetical protein
MNYHYKITHSITNETVIDSSLRNDFDGYLSENRAYMVALGSKVENRLSDLHKITIFNTI